MERKFLFATMSKSGTEVEEKGGRSEAKSGKVKEVVDVETRTTMKEIRSQQTKANPINIISASLALRTLPDLEAI